MTPEEVGRYAESLPQVKRKGTDSRPAWYVHDRLVARLHDPDTLVVRVPLDRRESLLEAYLDRAEDGAVRTAIDLAWELQHR